LYVKLNYTSLPFHCYVCPCFIFSFAMIAIMVGADGGNSEGRLGGGSGAV